jgi:hypothetical protein
MSPPFFPRTCPCPGAPFPPQGPSGRFPCFFGTTKHSDFLPLFPPCFVSFALRYRRRALGFVPAAARRYRCGPGITNRTPPHRIHRRRRQDLPGSWRTPLRTCPALRLRRDLSARPPPRFDVAFRLFDSVGSRENSNFGAQSHGPLTRCLRFAGWVAPPPRKTRFRMAGRPFRAGLGTRWVPTKGFWLFHSPFPGFAWRTEKLLQKPR